MKRWILALAVIVVLALAGGAYYLLTNLDAIVAAQIEKHGSAATGTKVSVGGVDIGLVEGRGTLRDLSVANPKGFSGKDVFRLGEITLDIDPKSVRSTPIVVDKVVIAAPEVNFEVDAQAHTNLQAILDNLKRGGGGAQEAPSEGQPVRLRIASFQFRDGRIEADTRAVGGKQVALDMPPLSLRDVGGSGGAPPQEIAKQVLRAYAESVARQVAKSEVNSQLDKLIDKKVGGEAGEAAKGLLKHVLE